VFEPIERGEREREKGRGEEGKRRREGRGERGICICKFIYILHTSKPNSNSCIYTYT